MEIGIPGGAKTAGFDKQGKAAEFRKVYHFKLSVLVYLFSHEAYCKDVVIAGIVSSQNRKKMC